MGLIRKTLAVSTVGLVRGSSKKQRVAKSQLKELRKQTGMMSDAVEEQNWQARGEAALARSRELQQAAKQRQALPATPVAAPAAGWYPAPDPREQHLLRWWDGEMWLDRTAPRV
jgi:hypothetical protein